MAVVETADTKDSMLQGSEDSRPTIIPCLLVNIFSILAGVFNSVFTVRSNKLCTRTEQIRGRGMACDVVASVFPREPRMQWGRRRSPQQIDDSLAESQPGIFTFVELFL